MALALAVALLAAPIGAQEPPPGSAYEQAVAARLRGQPDQAVTLLEPVVTAQPANADARVQLGYAYLALDRLDEAARAFQAALAIAPAYQDARLGLARIAQRRGDRSGALQHLAAANPQDAEVQTLRKQIEADPAAWRWALDLDASHAAVEGPQPAWKEFAVQLRHRPSSRTSLAARAEFARRFGRDDLYLEGFADRAIGTRARVYLLFGATADADFRPRWQMGSGGSLRVLDGPNPTVLTLDLRHSDFATGEVQTVVSGVEQYLLGGRAWVTGRWIHSFDGDDEHLSGYLVRGDVQATDELRVFVGLSDAPETSEGIVVSTRSYFGGASLDLREGVTLRVSAAIEDSDRGADRTHLSAGLGWRF